MCLSGEGVCGIGPCSSWFLGEGEGGGTELFLSTAHSERDRGQAFPAGSEVRLHWASIWERGLWTHAHLYQSPQTRGYYCCKDTVWEPAADCKYIHTCKRTYSYTVRFCSHWRLWYFQVHAEYSHYLSEMSAVMPTQGNYSSPSST